VFLTLTGRRADSDAGADVAVDEKAPPAARRRRFSRTDRRKAA
jgi:hypothetical protein